MELFLIFQMSLIVHTFLYCHDAKGDRNGYVTEKANNAGMTSLYVRGILQQQEMVALTDGKGRLPVRGI